MNRPGELDASAAALGRKVLPNPFLTCARRVPDREERRIKWRIVRILGVGRILRGRQGRLFLCAIRNTWCRSGTARCLGRIWDLCRHVWPPCDLQTRRAQILFRPCKMPPCLHLIEDSGSTQRGRGLDFSASLEPPAALAVLVQGNRLG